MSLDNLIDKIVAYKGSTGSVAYIERFDKNWLSFIIEEAETIQVIQNKFKEDDEKGFDIYKFVRIFLNILPHEEDETLYLALTLVDLFRSICDSYRREDCIKSSDILNYIIENFLNKNSKTHAIQTKKLPLQKKFHAQAERVRQIDLDAPVIYGTLDSQITRLNKAKVISDSTHHNNNGIRKVCFSEQTKKIFSLDSLADNICLFNLNCTLEKRIIPRQVKQNKETVILDFAWSNPQQRIGATVKEWALIFWEANDNFELEKNFSTINCLPDYQLRIWYIEFLNFWITTDKTCALHVWDIEKESVKFSISSPFIQANILDVVPLEILKLVAVCSLDKMITIWNFQKRRVLMKIDLSDGGVHSIAWSNSYQVLLTAGFENKIKVWSLDHTSQDTELLGKLVGHVSTVQTIEAIKDTPMIASADDSGYIKVWDIRNLNCVQTINLDVTTISKLIDISTFGKLAFIGNRINLLDFEDPVVSSNNSKEQAWPVKAEYDVTEDQIILCTRKDIRFIDTSVGRVKKIFVGLLQSEEADISVFKLMHQNKNFILGDDHGEMNMYNTSTGEQIKSFASHQNEVTMMKFDHANNLIVSSGGDSNIYIQKETKGSYEMKRMIKNLHFNKGISLMEVSVYHNIVLTTSNNNVIYVWDYEYAKLIANIQTYRDSEPTAIYFINGYAVIIIADTTGKIHFVHFKKKDTTFISFEKVAEIDISLIQSAENGEKDLYGEYATKIAVHIEEASAKNEVRKCNMYISTNKGNIKLYNILDVFKHQSVKHIPHANTRSSYNCQRNLEEDFLKVIGTYKLPVCDLSPIDNENIDPFITSAFDPASIKNLNDTLIKEFKGHSDCLTTLAITNSTTKRLLTTSLDCYVKMWTLEGELLGSVNINYPLPTVWNLDVKDTVQHKKKIFYALKIIDMILRQNKKDMFFEEVQKISVNPFLKSLSSSNSLSNSNQQRSQTVFIPRQETEKKNIVLMKDEYSPRDMQFDRVKHIYQKELQGPSLRQMEITKGILTNHQFASPKSKELALLKIQQEELHEKQADEERVRQEFVTFLVGDARSKILEQKDDNEGMKMFSKRLDTVVQVEKLAKTNSIILSQKPSVSTTEGFKRKRTMHFNGATLTNIQEVPSDLIPSSVKLSVTPSLDNPGALKFGLLRHKSQSRGMASLLSPVSRPKDYKNVDFFMYAKRRVGESDSNNSNSLPGLSGVADQGRKEIHSELYSRRLQKRSFNDILTRLDQSKRKSQNISTRFYGEMSNSGLQQTPVNNFRSSKIPSLNLDYEQKPSQTSASNLLSKQTVTGETKPFLEELQGFGEYMKESWNIKNNENSNTKILFTNIMKKVSRKDDSWKELTGGYPAKMKEILKEVVIEQRNNQKNES